MKINLCNVWVDRHNFDEAVNEIVQRSTSDEPPTYVTPNNTHCTVSMQSDERLRHIYNSAFLVVPDGVPLLWAAKFLKTPLSGRVNGTDLMEKLCAVAADNQLRIFFMGGSPEAAEKTAQLLQSRHPGLNVVGILCPPYGFETDAVALEQINETISSAKPHILFVGLGVPKQEYWIYENHQKIGVPVSIAVGASFELISGMVTRAPKWMQKTGLEWFYRLLMEPGRLWKRYLTCNTLFIWLVLKQRLGFLPSEYGLR
jgi:N-acetylglucosaminyldiphosphoundecaprenol N-acetyl-beta-D-mannosaminyltransferase